MQTGDESYTILLNTTANPDDVPLGLRPFFDYVREGILDTDDELVREIHEQVVGINDDSEWRDALMTWEEYLEEHMEASKAEGITIGKAEGKLEQLADFVKQELIPLDKALTLAEDPVKLKELLAKQ